VTAHRAEVTHAVHGFTAPGLDPVAAAFEENFASRGEVGAAFAAYRDGQLIVDLWGGRASPGEDRPWQRDTIQVIFSGTKGLVALCLLILVDRGVLDPDAPVSEYWPEFAAAGKHKVRVSDVASHQARLPGIRSPLAAEDLLDDVRMAELLAGQPQEADPRARYAYHPLTFGWLCGELVRRVDGRSVGQFFAEEIAGPLDLEIWIGLPAQHEARVATLTSAVGWGAALFDDKRLASDELLACVYANPGLLRSPEAHWNTRRFHAAEIPGAGAIGTARSIARLYGCLACGGQLDGVRLLAPETLRQGTRCLTRRREAISGEPEVYGFGFRVQSENRLEGPPADAFGHGGAGGSIHAAWPQEGIGLSYCMNYMRDDHEVDPRAQALLLALHNALDD
jgi:CubicO group peptidase (beta-lactamase class C family)